MKETIRSIIMCIIGAFLFSIAINTFSIPNQLGEGGVTGIGLMIYYLFKLPVSVSTIILNGVILLIGYRYLERKTMRLTIFATVMSSIFLQLTDSWSYEMDVAILAPLCSGAFVGLGIGIIMQAGGSTAGTDIIALIMNKYLGWSTSAALVVLDFFIVMPSIFIIGLENVVLTVVHLYVQTKVLNFVLEGFNPKKSVIIISEKHAEIAAEIDRVIGRGITYFYAQGYYQRDDKKVVMVVVNRQQIMPLNRLITHIDPLAFVVISEVQTVAGEGFSYILADEEQQHKTNEFIETGENIASK
ncbi:YitT family protein [Jeotgalibaca caeni]|uniref:YitT family protein n=1 Tax=Jeotgalibaca caeni TaxID=3028623 RepID=UPI00237E84DC|nr:YitT family protein [Jeotgalibaca caeni]MDE1547833.1 YitT family protein [Jeotgalibaca caeni]